MPESLQDLFDRARLIEMTPEQAERQRRSFAFGNTRIEDAAMTGEAIDAAAEKLHTDGMNSAQD